MLCLASQSKINNGVRNLRKTGALWEGNDIINTSLKVGSLVNDIVSALKYVISITSNLHACYIDL